MSESDFAWFAGFFKGDGSITYGRVAVDTTTPAFAKRLVANLSRLTSKEVKFEVYGSAKNFSDSLSKNFLHYPQKSANASDCVKIKVDSVGFARSLKQTVDGFLAEIDGKDVQMKSDFLQGFFDAEGSVSVDGTVQIDLCKSNGNLLTQVSVLLADLGIEHKILESERKVRLIVLGRRGKVQNLEKFRVMVNFSAAPKNQELDAIIEIYSRPKDGRSRKEISEALEKILSQQTIVGMKSLMTLLKVKYRTLNRIVNRLAEEKTLKRVSIHKRVFIERLITPAQSAKTCIQAFA